MDPSMAEELASVASNALKRTLDENQIQRLVNMHEYFLDYKESREPYVSDQRFLSNEDYFEFYRKLRTRAKNLLDGLQDRDRHLRKAPSYKKFLTELVFANAVKEVKMVLRLSDLEIKMIEITKDPEKLADCLESGKVRFVPRSEGLPPEVLNRIRERKKRKGGPTPNFLLHSYIKAMAAWYEEAIGRRPSPSNKGFADLLNGCWNIIDEDQTIGDKIIRNALKNRP